MNLKTFFFDKLLTINLDVGTDVNKGNGFYNKILSLSISMLELMVDIILKSTIFFRLFESIPMAISRLISVSFEIASGKKTNLFSETEYYN